MKYYLINNKIMKGGEMPNSLVYDHPNQYNGAFNQWLSSLQPCEISESEIMKIYVHLFPNLSYNKQDATPIDVTDIVSAQVICNTDRCDGECIECTNMVLKVKFKQPTEKQVYSDAVEFAEWIHINAQPRLPNKNQWKMYNNSVVITTQELYEIFKNR